MARFAATTPRFCRYPEKAMLRKIGMRALRVLLASLGIFAAYAVLVCVPQPFFSYRVKAGGLTLYADRPIEVAAAERILGLARERLEKCPLYAANPEAQVFICNARWRQRLFFNTRYGVAGVSLYPTTYNVFLREARLEENRLISPSGKPVEGERTLDYFVAHEVTHELTGRRVGPWTFVRMPQWVREGYADYVAKGTGFDYAGTRKAFLAGAPELDLKRSGLYLRFNLLVAYLLDHRHWTVDRLLRGPWPPQDQVESEVQSEN